MEIKIIDFLTKLAKNEEIKKVKFNGIIYEKSENGNYYHNDRNLFEFYNIHFCLNDEIEIIEENKPIEKFEINYARDIEEKIFYEESDKPNHCILGDAGTELLINKINEIIDKLNKLEERKK